MRRLSFCLVALAASLPASPVMAQTFAPPANLSTGTDYSANAATIPLAGTVLLATIPATRGRIYIEAQNQSAGTIQIVRDDGAGNNQTSILLGPGGAASQGGGWSSWTFKGRLRIYGASGAEVSAYQE